ncbi:MAG: hypothetical protein U5N58_10700 [Actinomycetota bacterium]|nr:hypothetical protein [Actinomycetota bacterium]
MEYKRMAIPLTGLLKGYPIQKEGGSMTKDYQEYINELTAQKLLDSLHQKGYKHLKKVVRGQHLVIYSTNPEGDKFNRIRFSQISGTEYQLGIANHKGRWEAMPFTGTLSELTKLLTEQFGFC